MTTATTKKTNMAIVNTILQQLGGRRFIAMTGSKNFVATSETTLRMNLTRNATSANRLEITYNYGTDLYTMKFYRLAVKHDYPFTTTTKVIAEYEDVYADSLQDIFTHVTHLYTHF